MPEHRDPARRPHAPRGRARLALATLPSLVACAAPAHAPHAAAPRERPATAFTRAWSNQAIARDDCAPRRPAAPMPAVEDGGAGDGGAGDGGAALGLVLPPALLNYPLLGRLTTGRGACGSMEACVETQTGLGLGYYAPSAGYAYAAWLRLPAVAFETFVGEQPDCTTRWALLRGLSSADLEACVQGDLASLRCGEVRWLTTSLVVTQPATPSVRAMFAGAGVEASVASCLARALLHARYPAHEGPTPVQVPLGFAWWRRRCAPQS